MFENRKLIIPYFAPYFAYVAIASFLSDIPIEINYLLRIIATGTLLVWAWKWYIPITGPKNPYYSILTGVCFGFVGFVLWIGLLFPFVKPDTSAQWTVASSILRLFAAGLLVPLFEEILMRGFVFRFTIQWQELRKKNHTAPFEECLDQKSINTISPLSWSWTAILVSTLLFTLGHQYHEWPASIGYGLLMSFLLVYRKDLLTCIIAHAVTNITLALFVISTSKTHFW